MSVVMTRTAIRRSKLHLRPKSKERVYPKKFEHPLAWLANSIGGQEGPIGVLTDAEDAGMSSGSKRPAYSPADGFHLRWNVLQGVWIRKDGEDPALHPQLPGVQRTCNYTWAT